jgi:hypothetical protein
MGARWWERDYIYSVGNVDAIDMVDERLIYETATSTGKIRAWADDPFNSDPNEGTEWRRLLAFRADTATGAAPFNRPADWDIDRDGIPDDWEIAHGLRPNTADNNGDFDADGYTNVEEYINEIAAWPAPQPIGFDGSTNDRYAESTNWDIDWQPSKFDNVRITGGLALVDAVGQHAGQLVIAPSEGDMAQLKVTGGWLMVHDALVIGGTSTASGSLHLSGGTLVTPVLAKGDSGAFHFTGGMLRAGIVDFDLVNSGGTLSKWSSSGITTVNGDLQISSGAIQIDLSAPTSFDHFIVNGDVVLGGELRLVMQNGFIPTTDHAFTIISGQNFSGQFVNVTSDGRVYTANGSGSFLLTIDRTRVTLSHFRQSIAGDFNDDGVVDAADYVLWRRNHNTVNGLPNDPIGGHITVAQYVLWRTNFGRSTNDTTTLDAMNLPEPSITIVSGLSIILSAIWICSAPKRRTSTCRWDAELAVGSLKTGLFSPRLPGALNQ